MNIWYRFLCSKTFGNSVEAYLNSTMIIVIFLLFASVMLSIKFKYCLINNQYLIDKHG